MRTRSLLPRPEYPRPDRQRSFLQGVDWLNLNGAWEFRFDADDRGRDKRWFDPDGSDLPRHPHDARGALTYLRGGRGGYGYLCHATIECELPDEVVNNLRGNHLRLRFLVPRDEQPQDGLTIYGYDAGRYPRGPTVIIDQLV
jgi:hypothetical protein